MSTAHALPPQALAADLRLPRSRILQVTTAIGVLSGLRIYLTYNMLGVSVSFLDGITSGLLDWWLWIPLVPVVHHLASRFEPSQARALPAIGLHLMAGVLVALVHMLLFAAASGAIRAVRFDGPLQLNLASPLLHLAPALVIYWIFVVACWWRSSRHLLSAATTHEPQPVAPSLVAFRAGHRELLVRPDEVDWVAAAGNYLELNGGSATHLVRETLKAAHERLGPQQFLRIHRSTLVRRAAVATVSEDRSSANVVLRDGTRLPVGRSFRSALSGLRA